MIHISRLFEKNGRGNGVQIAITQAMLVFVPCLILLYFIFLATSNHFSYSLDDPYIHLTLAKNIWHGTYGINIGEFEAPSSSILWPFLLAPFSIWSPLFEFIPLIFNLFFLSGLVCILSILFDDVPYLPRQILIFLILLSLNIYGLVFNGLEHCLQIVLVTLVLFPLIREDYSESSVLCGMQMMALVVLPLVRYEGLAISLPVLLCLFIKGERKKSLVCAGLLLSLMGGFSLFLHQHDLGYLPSSVLSKTMHSVFTNLTFNLKMHYLLFLFCVFLVVVLLKQSRVLACMVMMTAMLHFCFGQFGWLGRYEVYFLLFLVLISLRLAIKLNVNFFPILCVLPFIFCSLFLATIQTAGAANNIYYQQAQMAKIANMLSEPVAVTDLGLMSLKSGQYILDLWGLGSIEALNFRKSHSDDAIWMKELMDKKKVKFAFIYEKWLPRRPAFWIKVGEFTLKDASIIVGSKTVSFFATDQTSAKKLRATLKKYEKQANQHHVEIVLT